MLGYEILPSAQEGRRPSHTYADPENALREYLKPFSFKAICGLAAHLMARRAKSRSQFAADLKGVGADSRIEFLPYLIRRVVLAAAEACHHDLAGREMSAAELREALFIAEDFTTAADREAKTPEDVLIMFLRLQQHAIHDNADMSYVFREATGSLDVLETCGRMGLDLDAQFEGKYGVTYRRFLLGCLGLWGKVTKDGEEGWYLPPKQTADLGLGLDPEVILGQIQADRRGLLEEWHQRLIPEFEAYSLSPLKRFPAVLHSDGSRSIPVTNDLLDRPLRLFFFDLIQLLHGRDQGIFRAAIGEVHEEYVRRALEAALPTGSVHRANEALKPAEGERVCDLVCVERSAITFVEVKSARFPLAIDVTKARDGLREAVAREGGLADAVSQLADSADIYRSGRSTLPRRDRVLGLVVTPGERVGLNTSLVRDIIAEGHAKQASSERFVDYLIADDLGFHELIRHTASGKPLGGTLRRLLRGRNREADLHTQLPNTLVAHPLHASFSEVTDRLQREISARR